MFTEQYKKDGWTTVIDGDKKNNIFKFSNIWYYRHTMAALVKNDIIMPHTQTILGTAWHILNPLLTTLIFVFVFGRVIKIPLNNTPPLLFYLSGICIWNYFSTTFSIASKSLVNNADLIKKVYFPKIILPVSIGISGLYKLLIQFSIFVIIYLYYWFSDIVSPNWSLLGTPFYILLLFCFTLGMALITSSFSVKYRDFGLLANYLISLFLFISPVIYPSSLLPGKLAIFANINPLVGIIEGIRHGWLGTHDFNLYQLLFSSVISLLILIVGVLLHKRIENRISDVI